MSVYTQLHQHDISTILTDYSLGELHSFSGIPAGIENSNYFVNTSAGRFVLTIFERLTVDELPYFMDLMHYLSEGSLCSPAVQRRKKNETLFEFTDNKGKLHHGCIVSCLPGEVLDHLSVVQLRDAGATMARMHLAGADFPQHRDNPTGSDWLQARVNDVQQAVGERYGKEVQTLLLNELSLQQQAQLNELPQGLIHGDYFRDNMLFEGDVVSGVIDFYYAHNSSYVMDLAIAVNALSLEPATFDEARSTALLAGYHSVRPLQQQEWAALPSLLRQATLRFWVSRLYDACFPREGEMTTTLDPEEYRVKLQFHHQHASLIDSIQRTLGIKQGAC